MCAGVSKSGSPAPRPITSLPSALRRAARAVTASVGEGLTRWTRRETGRVTEFPVVRLRSSGAAILRDCVRPRPSSQARSATSRSVHHAWNAAFQARSRLTSPPAISRRRSTSSSRASTRDSRTRRCSASPAAARPLPQRQVIAARAAPHHGAGAQQDARRAALRGVPRVLSAQRGGVLRLLLRLLPARGLRAVLATPTSRRTPR